MVSPGFWNFSLNMVIPRLLEGMVVTLQLTFISGIIGLSVGILVAFLRMSKNPFFRYISLTYVTVLRGTPLLLQILFIYFALPNLLNIRLDSFPAGVLALGLNGSAYFGEIFRAGIESIHKGQMEAARALGLSYFQAMRKVIIPQSIRRLIPPMVNEFAALSKDTSLVSVVSLTELLYTTQRLSAKYLRPWEVYLWAALGYLTIVLCLTYVASRIEKNLKARGGV